MNDDEKIRWLDPEKIDPEKYLALIKELEETKRQLYEITKPRGFKPCAEVNFIPKN